MTFDEWCRDNAKRGNNLSAGEMCKDAWNARGKADIAICENLKTRFDACYINTPVEHCPLADSGYESVIDSIKEIDIK